MKMNEMEVLVKELKAADDAYYNGKEIMSNAEYDKKYETLLSMEQDTGVVLPNSPTQRVGYVVVDTLPKLRHEYPAKSLAKDKDVTLFPKVFSVQDFLAVVMWKCDGSTLVATYDNGKLTTLVTRGDGEVGQVVTHNAPYIRGLPMEISYKGHLVVRGEAVMTYAEFDRINRNLKEGQDLYKNPRNLANATVSSLDSKVLSEREIWFVGFTLAHMDKNASMTFEERMTTLSTLGFNVVEYVVTKVENLINVIEDFTKRVTSSVGSPSFPVDGLVIAANDVSYALIQPETNKAPNKLVGYALKWEDEEITSTLRDIEWSASRTGLINPVAIFDPIEIEGTTVRRASVHNVSEVERLNLHIGDTISVIKANKIIPQIVANLTATEYEAKVGCPMKRMQPITTCPVCGCPTEICSSTFTAASTVPKKVTKTLWCKNPNCAAKKIGKFVKFCERDCMNIDNLATASLEKFINMGWLQHLDDLYTFTKEYASEIASLEGFGEKSLKNIDLAIESSRKTSFVPFIHALGIPNVGNGQAKIFCQEYAGNIELFFSDIKAKRDFSSMENIGPVITSSLHEWGERYLDDSMESEESVELSNLLKYLEFEMPQKDNNSEQLKGLTFVITGNLQYHENREQLISVIESMGGKVSGSVSSKTSFLLNNDVASTSGKNKKAQELGVKIISETDFMQQFNLTAKK